MKLKRLKVTNFRSIKDTGDISIESLQAFVGENSCGKSNLLRSIQCFLTSGAGGLQSTDFNKLDEMVTIECEFDALADHQKRELRRYLVGNKIILRKELWVETDPEKGKTSIKSAYHGYQAQPKEAHFSVDKLEEAYGAKPNWEKIATDAGILDIVRASTGKVTKASYAAGIAKYLAANDVEYDEPVLGETQALGLAPNLLSHLPAFYLLPANADYADEIGRSTTTVFRRLMSDLGERIMRADPRYVELETALDKVRALLNQISGEEAPPRLAALGQIEGSLSDLLKRLMPSVRSVELGVEVEPSPELFSRGVSIRIDDGVLTDVVSKGHGMQRSLIFAMLQMLMQSARVATAGSVRPIILAIEEPELYIHPHCQRLIFNVLKDFAGAGETVSATSDQVLYCTHSPAFIEIWNYERIAVVRKDTLAEGTIVRQASAGVLHDGDDRKTFNLLTSFSLKHNELFFARDVVLVEGFADEVAIISTARKLRRIVELPDEIGLSIVVTGNKEEIPKFQKVLNALGIRYGVILEMDGHDAAHQKNFAISSLVGSNRIGRFPKKLEDMVGHPGKFDGKRGVVNFFSDPARITSELEGVVTAVLPP